MGVIITASGLSNGSSSYDGDDTGSVVEHLSRAGRAAIDAAGIDDREVGVLINSGVYRDSNTVEPAIGALIQQGIGLGLTYQRSDPKCFSFDLMNGACGMLNAVQVADSLLATTGTTRVLLVGGDTHPSTTRQAAGADFPYDLAGAALLLERRDGDVGFGRVHSRLLPGPTGVEGFVDTTSMGTRGRSVMTVRRSPDFAESLLDLAEATAVQALDEAFGPGGGDADSPAADRAGVVLISSRPTPGFAAALAERLRLPLAAGELPGDTHTAALAQAYHRADEAGTIAGATAVLFVAAGAGPSAGAVLYRTPGGER